VPVFADSLRTKSVNSLFDEALELVLRHRLRVGLGESLPEKVGKFFLRQLAILIGVGGREQSVEARVCSVHRHPRHATSTVTARSPSAPVEGEKPAAPKGVTAEPMSSSSVPGEGMTAESAMLETVPGETVLGETMAVMTAVADEAMAVVPGIAPPLVMMANPKVSTRGPRVSRMTAMTAVGGKFKAVTSREAVPAPSPRRPPVTTFKVEVRRVTPAEGGTILPSHAHASGTAVRSEAPGTATGTSSVHRRRSGVRSTRSPLRSWPAPFPRGLTIASARGTFFTLLPVGVARPALVGCVSPLGSASFLAISVLVAIGHSFFAVTIVPGDVSIFIKPLIAAHAPFRAPLFASKFLAITARPPASISSHFTIVGSGIAPVRVAIRAISHVIRASLTHWVGSPLALTGKLHQRSRRNPSKKQQRVVAHRHFLVTSDAGPILRIDAVTDLGTRLASRPVDVSRPRLREG
jgi:hypothetical protein